MVFYTSESTLLGDAYIVYDNSKSYPNIGFLSRSRHSLGFMPTLNLYPIIYGYSIIYVINIYIYIYIYIYYIPDLSDISYTILTIL